MFRSILSKIAKDKDYPARTFTIDALSRVRDGAIYDHLPYGFHEEENDAGEYTKLRDRRPSVRHNICRIVVDEAVALLFSEGHFPTPELDDAERRDALVEMAKAAKLNEVMIEAATTGSVGSVAIHMRVLKQKDKSHRLFYDVYDTRYLTPTYLPEAPDTLEKITEKYKVRGCDLKALGYSIDEKDLTTQFWFSREWDDAAETWFTPWTLFDGAKDGFTPTVDLKRSVTHDLGFVPWVWVKNLPGKLKFIDCVQAPVYSDIDGACTFDAAIETTIEGEYLLSQGGRGIKYTMDPLLVVNEPAAPQEAGFVKSPANAMVVDEGGDAKLLEITGSAFAVVMEWAKALRAIALESIHGNRADADKLSAAQSGRAMELMNQSLIWLADKMRISYGEGAYRQLLCMAIKAHEKFPLSVNGVEMMKFPANTVIALNWPTWFAPTTKDLQEQATTIKSLREAKVLSKHTAIANIAFAYDIDNVEDEMALIDADFQQELKEVAAVGVITEQIKATE